MATFTEITRLTGTISIVVAPRHASPACRGTLNVTTALTGTARKNAVADIKGTLPVTVTLQPATTRSFGTGVATLEKLLALGTNYAYSEGRAALAPLTSFANQGSPPGSYAIGESSLSLFASSGINLGGGLGQAAVSLQLLASMGANYAHSAGIVTLGALTSLGAKSIFPDIVFSTATVRAAHRVVAPTNVITIASAATAKRAARVTAASAGTVTTAATARAIHHLLAGSSGIVVSPAYQYGSVSSPGPVAPTAQHRFEDGETWFINAVTFAASRVDGYYFDSLASLGGSVYGAGPDGIFELVGDTDDGARIESSFAIGRERFNIPNVKSLSAGYITGTSAGTLEARVIDDRGQAHTYETERALGDTVRSVRFKPGKGLKMHELQLEVRNKDGEAFEVHHIDILPQVLSRRVKG